MQRFFPVSKGSLVEAFGELAPNYPVFEMKPLQEAGGGFVLIGFAAQSATKDALRLETGYIDAQPGDCVWPIA